MTTALPLVRVRLKYPDLDTFAERFAPNVTRGGIFLVSREPQPVGTLLRFEVSLLSGTPVLIGQGRVTWTKAYDPQEPSKPYGMGVQFTDLDPASRPVLGRLLASRRVEPGRAQPGTASSPAPAPSRESETRKTQPLRRLAQPHVVPLPSESPPSSSTPTSSPPSFSSPSFSSSGRHLPEEDLPALDRLTEDALKQAIERARVLAAEVKDVEDLLHPAPRQPPTLSQALTELPRHLGLRSSDPVH